MSRRLFAERCVSTKLTIATTGRATVGDERSDAGHNCGRDIRWFSAVLMDVQDMRIFARVAEVQNLSAVGQELGLTPGTISKRLQALEDELRVRLFERTTRSIRITDEGRTFREHVSRILGELDSALAAIGESVTQPRGRLKVTAPAALAIDYIAPAFCSFMRAYPEIEVQVDLSDRMANLQDEGYDLAIRLGPLTDSTLIAKRLAPDRVIVVAAPGYLAVNGTPAKPEDVAAHSCLVLGDAFAWTFEDGESAHSVRVAGRLKSNSSEMLHHAALAGEGLLRVSELKVMRDLASGRLVQVLDQYPTDSTSAIWAVYPSAKHVLPKLRVLLDFLGTWFRDQARAGSG